MTVYVAGPGLDSGTLDLHSTGDILIDGIIDVSGGPGTQNSITSESTQMGHAGSGGYTGEPYQSAVQSAACSVHRRQRRPARARDAGHARLVQRPLDDGLHVNQSDPSALLFTSPVAQYGGGGGRLPRATRAYGSGGGGRAGGAPGALGPAYPGEDGCSGASGRRRRRQRPRRRRRRRALRWTGRHPRPNAVPRHQPRRSLRRTWAAAAAASIGALAVADLAVSTTFQTGSGGGGGSADYLNRPVFGGTSGGGGAGGALRLSTPATITITGMLLANGGPGGDANTGIGSNANCDPQPGAAGGGGSGGVIYLSAPSLTVGSAATIMAAGGGGGGGSEFATGGAGGKGGLGRIRMSVGASCSLSGTFNPPLANGCNATAGGVRGKTFIGAFPN